MVSSLRNSRNWSTVKIFNDVGESNRNIAAGWRKTIRVSFEGICTQRNEKMENFLAGRGQTENME